VEVVSLFVSLMLCQRICFGNSALKRAIEIGLTITFTGKFVSAAKMDLNSSLLLITD